MFVACSHVSHNTKRYRQTTDRTSYHKCDRTTQYGRLKADLAHVPVTVYQHTEKFQILTMISIINALNYNFFCDWLCFGNCCCHLPNGDICLPLDIYRKRTVNCHRHIVILKQTTSFKTLLRRGTHVAKCFLVMVVTTEYLQHGFSNSSLSTQYLQILTILCWVSAHCSHPKNYCPPLATCKRK